ncbi:L,D-transpeptidase family protein [Streptomyces sp. NPDC057806]|uniref:L,D-transpeptidase family protein n=1 Tax=Streptomyces sp. NPDC057806 TaxID=3346255 RepID=UPI0036A5F4FE
MHALSRQVVTIATVLGTLTLTGACGGQADDQQEAASESVSAPQASQSGSPEASGSASPSGSPSTRGSASASVSPSVSASASTAAADNAGKESTSGSTTGGSGGDTTVPAAPDFPVPVEVGDATQVITVKASGSYATVTAWAKGPSGWKAQFSTGSGRVGSNGVTSGATRMQNTYTTPGGTYTITEGFGHLPGGTAMPYHVVTDDDWWVQDPESKFYNQMHGEAGADFPLTESGDRGSEHLINYPTQYAKALVINFNRWPATPGRGAGIFLHVNGNGATAGCVSVPRATMDQIMSWITPSAHPRIAIG